MKKTKLEKGITLIALIITIVILLILAVVTIGAVQNGGIITHAQNTKLIYQVAQIEEALKLKMQEEKLAIAAGDLVVGTEGDINSYHSWAEYMELIVSAMPSVSYGNVYSDVEPNKGELIGKKLLWLATDCINGKGIFEIEGQLPFSPLGINTNLGQNGEYFDFMDMSTGNISALANKDIFFFDQSYDLYYIDGEGNIVTSKGIYKADEIYVGSEYFDPEVSLSAAEKVVYDGIYGGALAFSGDPVYAEKLATADWVLTEAESYVGQQENDVYILTTLDQNLQEKASTILQQEIQKAKANNVTEGAVIIMDKYGAVKAMAGGTKYAKTQFNRATQAIRQSGSIFKLFVYMTAIEQGMTPDDLIVDEPIKIGKWRPQNHDKKYYGNVSLRYAFAKSLNLATVGLARKIGIKNIVKTAEKAGVHIKSDNDLSLALGTAGVKLIDLVSAYATIANGGFAVWPHAIEEVYSKDGFQLYLRSDKQNLRIFAEKDVKMMKELLHEVVKSGTGRNANIGRLAFAKTGTSQDYRDAWFVGFDDNLICGVWVGNDDNSPMKNVYGSGLPAKIWQKIMQ